MLFSILIAHYNNYDYFLDCYKSILAQTYQNFEVIIVDDCSTDNSYEKLQELLKDDSRFKLYKNEQNKGVGFTKRRCVELANGDICGFVDPDDAITENALAEMINIYQKKTNTVAVYSQMYYCDNALNIKSIPKTNKKIKNKKPYFFNIFYEVHHFCSFSRNSYLKTSEIDDGITSAVDQDLYLKLYEQGDFVFIKKPLYLYRLHNSGVSQEKSKKQALRKNWNTVIANTLTRRNIKKLYGKNISEIDDLATFIYQNQNTFWTRLLRKLL